MERESRKSITNEDERERNKAQQERAIKGRCIMFIRMPESGEEREE
jgi:hypothetical protein